MKLKTLFHSRWHVGGVGWMVLTGVFDSEWTFEEVEFIGRKTSPTEGSAYNDWERIKHEWNVWERSTRKWAI